MEYTNKCLELFLRGFGRDPFNTLRLSRNSIGFSDQELMEIIERSIIHDMMYTELQPTYKICRVETILEPSEPGYLKTHIILYITWDVWTGIPYLMKLQRKIEDDIKIIPYF